MKPLSITFLTVCLVHFPVVIDAQEFRFKETPGIPSLPSDFSFGRQSLIRGPKSEQGVDQPSGSIRPSNTHATWSAMLEPAQIAAGEKGQIVLRAVIDDGFHIYPYQPSDTEVLNRTVIVATQKSGLKLAVPQTSAKIVSSELSGVAHYDGSVTWVIPISVPLDAAPGEHAVELQIGFNTCNDTTCDPPAAVKLNGTIEVGSTTGAAARQMLAQEIDFEAIKGSNAQASWQESSDVKVSLASRLSGDPLQAWMVFAALGGGFILNFMPCVLPVVGLKLLSFVNQAGNNRAGVITLNLAFVAGILVVVLALATFNIFTKLAGQAVGWGEQFNSFSLQLTIVVLLFAMSLSFLGVWEIPIPGFATGSQASELMQKEGVSGAFYKGILTTLLATPCSGPLLGAVFGETLKLSAFGSVIVFLCVGLGLGLPYLAMCLWPNAVRMLPKPGPWMDTLKQVLAFPLLLSMIWFLNVIDSQYHIAVLVLLIFVWFGCWLVGRVPAYAERHTKFRIAMIAIAVCFLAGVGSIRFFGPVQHLLPWQPYSEAALISNRSSGKVVLIEFTARWCPTCQTNMRFAIERPEVAKLVEQHQVVTLLADWTDSSPKSATATAIRDKVHELESNSIPLLAVYPADPNAPPIVLRDMITQQQLLDAIQQALPANSASNSRAMVR